MKNKFQKRAILKKVIHKKDGKGWAAGTLLAGGGPGKTSKGKSSDQSVGLNAASVRMMRNEATPTDLKNLRYAVTGRTSAPAGLINQQIAREASAPSRITTAPANFPNTASGMRGWDKQLREMHGEAKRGALSVPDYLTTVSVRSIKPIVKPKIKNIPAGVTRIPARGATSPASGKNAPFTGKK